MWNWQHDTWASFEYDPSRIQPVDLAFLQGSGFLFGVFEHLSQQDKHNIIIDVLSTEAVKTSAIEGEVLNRDSVQASLRRSFGLAVDHRKVPAAEQGISQMMLDLYQNFTEPLTHDTLFNWHRMIMNGRDDLEQKGAYRTHPEPMQVVSGKIYDPTVHFEAPPSDRVPEEMNQFIQWFNNTAPDGKNPLSASTRAAIAHLYFVSIHPFEDGNGRISRALSEKVLSQSFKKPALLSLSYAIERNKKAYYSHLEASNKVMEITPWLLYFAEVIFQAQQYTQKRLEFLIAKTKFYDRFRGMLNPRQEKVITRMFYEGFEGFTGGLSTKNYQSIAKAPKATATRDLQDLVKKGALMVTGAARGTRYHLKLNLDSPSSPSA